MDLNEQSSTPKTMNEKLITLIYLLKRFAEVTLQDGESLQKAILSEITSLFTEVIPAVLAVYNNPAMADYAEDASYWITQMKRIMDTISENDTMAQMDVLYFETCKNLIELDDLLCKKGIEL